LACSKYVPCEPRRFFIFSEEVGNGHWSNRSERRLRAIVDTAMCIKFRIPFACFGNSDIKVSAKRRMSKHASFLQ
jgi:hypothetical protein